MVERPDPGCQHGHAPGCLGPGNRRAETYPGMHAGQALTEPRPSPTDPDLDLHGRLEAVDVGTIQESDLDESHDPTMITQRRNHPRVRRSRDAPEPSPARTIG